MVLVCAKIAPPAINHIGIYCLQKSNSHSILPGIEVIGVLTSSGRSSEAAPGCWVGGWVGWGWGVTHDDLLGDLLAILSTIIDRSRSILNPMIFIGGHSLPIKLANEQDRVLYS